MLPRVSTRFLFPLFRLDFFLFFLFPNSTWLFLLVSTWTTIVVRATFASCLLSSPPHRSSPPSASICRQRIFPNLGPSSTGIGPEALVLVVRKSLDRASFRQNRRAGGTRSHVSYALRVLVHVCTYIRTYIHTYIHICIFLYIDIYSAICFLLVLVQRKRESLSLFYLSEEKFHDFEKGVRSRPYKFWNTSKIHDLKTLCFLRFVRPWLDFSIDFLLEGRGTLFCCLLTCNVQSPLRNSLSLSLSLSRSLTRTLSSSLSLSFVLPCTLSLTYIPYMYTSSSIISSKIPFSP